MYYVSFSLPFFFGGGEGEKRGICLDLCGYTAIFSSPALASSPLRRRLCLEFVLPSFYSYTPQTDSDDKEEEESTSM